MANRFPEPDHESCGVDTLRATFIALISENNALIRSDQLDIGRRIVTERTAIYTRLACTWVRDRHMEFGYDKPFALVSLGGTGRGEMTPFSDTDFAFLFDDALEGNGFLLELQQHILHSDRFEDEVGFALEALPFSLDDVADLSGKQLNAFLDMRPVYDPRGLCGVFRERIRAVYDPFEHFLHVREFWDGQWEEASRRSEDLDHFDIKNEGLRIFLAGIWTLAGKDFQHSQEIYEQLADPRDLQAYDFLLRIRAFVHSRRKGPRRSSAGGSHPEDILTFEDFLSFGEMLGPEAGARARFEFGNEVRSRLLASRRRIALFAKSVLRQELKTGRRASQDSPIVYGLGGLRLTSPTEDGSPSAKSRDALSLLLASQRYRTPIDLTELQGAFWNAGDWLERVPELSALFYEENGSLADTFEFLSRIEGAEDRLFPGCARFESSLDERVMTERKSLRGKLQRQKIHTLETYLIRGRTTLGSATSDPRVVEFKIETDPEIEAASLDSDHIAAIKLALKTKRLPLTQRDIAASKDEASPLYDRFSSGFSGIPLDAYYQPFIDEGGFSKQVIDIVEFLITHRRTFKTRTQTGMNDTQLVNEFARLCGSEDRLRALFVFTCADRADWESEKDEPDRWFNIKELYMKTLRKFRPSSDPTTALAAAGYSQDELAILKDFGQDFFAGRYRSYANRFGSHLVRLAQEAEFDAPKIALLRDGASIILGVAARDFRGLAVTISGELLQKGIDLRQAHLFSSSQYGLVLDFFHLNMTGGTFPRDLTTDIEAAVTRRAHIEDADGESGAYLEGRVTLQEWRPRQYCLRFEGPPDAEGVIHALTRWIYGRLGANIYGLAARTTRTLSFVSIYHSLPESLSLQEAKALVKSHF